MKVLSTEGMETLRPSETVEPFSQINFWRLPGGKVRVRAYVLMERSIEGAQAGVAIDGSVSMRKDFGKKGLLGFLSPGPPVNAVEPVARDMCAYLAQKVSADGKVAIIYWATGANGSKTEKVGMLTEGQIGKQPFEGPRKFGGGTKLLPALRYFVEQFTSAPWGMYLFLTDGGLHDLEEVKRYSTQLARDVASGKRNELKLVLIGVGDEVDAGQLQELDDLDTGTNVDLWDHRLATEIKQLAEIFAEVVDENIIIAENGLVRDTSGNIVMDYRDKGVPALMVFTLPRGSDAFVLEIGNRAVRQPLPV